MRTLWFTYVVFDLVIPIGMVLLGMACTRYPELVPWLVGIQIALGLLLLLVTLTLPRVVRWYERRLHTRHQRRIAQHMVAQRWELPLEARCPEQNERRS